MSIYEAVIMGFDRRQKYEIHQFVAVIGVFWLCFEAIWVTAPYQNGLLGWLILCAIFIGLVILAVFIMANHYGPDGQLYRFAHRNWKQIVIGVCIILCLLLIWQDVAIYQEKMWRAILQNAWPAAPLILLQISEWRKPER